MGARLVIDETSTLSMEQRLERLSLESNYMTNLIDHFRTSIPALGQDLKDKFSSLTGADNPNLEEFYSADKEFKDLAVKLPDAVYLNISSTVVSVPEGFKGDLKAYLIFLLRMSDDIFRSANLLLSGYNSVLSTFVTNKQDKISLADHTDIYRRAKHERDVFTVGVKVFFPDTGVTSKKRLSDVCERLTDLKDVNELVKKLGREKKEHNLKAVERSVDQAVKLLDQVINDVQSNGITNVSGAAARNIAEGAYEIGKYVEMIALYTTMVDQAAATVNKLFKQLKDIV